jgi:esterase/lipase superfamily enzyme
MANHPDTRFRMGLGIAVFLFALTLPYLRIRYRKVPDDPLPRRHTAWITFWLITGSLALGLWGAATANDAWYLYRSHRVGPEFGAARSVNRQVYYGYCDVSIPPSHQVGLVEQPLLGAEDESHHVVIECSTLLPDETFFQTVRTVLAGCPRQDTFVFVHGHNVSFDQAARRTAQIHYDLEFQGVPIFYSWPSRSNVRLYASDRNEIGYSVEHIKQFLLDVKNRVQPGRIHVIAHSMGAEGVARAIASLEPGDKVFDQIILAAPDIDADVFREQLAPRLVQESQRTTLYCSRNDWALHASYAFNDSPRVGDSSYGVVVRPDMDTIDTSDIDTDLLGHSYYGDCLPILRDVRLMMERHLKPEERELERAVMPENLIYWLFHRTP